ncbi:MAG: Gfo/Idh/MocA family oxidoreductase [Ruminococcaceae bacterium]|nr:Gfo/Idh/MocA family oxidoreductase [Oscillospiraceae bacterium]
MKIIKAACVGAGNRGIIYSNFAFTNSDKMKLIAVVDPNEFHRVDLAKKHGIPADMQFETVEDFVAKHPECDLVINATIDNIHYKTAKPLINAGYNVLLEKPITANVDELLELCRLADENKVSIFICHLLRYTPFYKNIKQHLLAGDIGKIVSIKMSEYVGVSHFIESFVVGKWRSEAECGSSLLLAKSCHDMDLLCWLNNSTSPKKITSFGSRRVFIPENAPAGHTDTCHTCLYEKSCKYSLTNLFNGASGAWKRIILDIKKPSNEVTQEDINEQVKKSSYGRCVYEQKDLVDRQNIIVEFQDGSVGTFDLIGAVAKGERYIHIVGEDGEIIGTRGDGRYTLRKYDFKNKEYIDYNYDISSQIIGGHSGGDVGIMNDVCSYLNRDTTSISMTSIADSVNGHLCVYAAEKARRTESVVKI